MKKIISLLAVVFISVLGFGQKDEPVLTFVQVMPTYPDGEKALYEFLYNNISYPEREKAMNIEGTVFVNFVIEKDGTPTNFNVTRGVEDGLGLDKAALSACKKLGKFNPGTQNGVPQRVYLTIPIKFTLEDDAPVAEPQLTAKEVKEITKDAEFLCEAIFEIVKADNEGDTKKYEKLKKQLESKTGKLQSKYLRGSAKEKELERQVRPCLEEAMKNILDK